FRLAVAAKLGILEILNELKRLREDLNKIAEILLEHDSKLSRIENELKEQAKNIEEMRKILIEHDQRLREHDERLDRIEKKLSENDKRLEKIEEKLKEHDGRLDRIERKLSDHDERLKRIEEKLKEHDERFNRIEKKLSEHDERFRRIEEKLSEHDERLSRIERKLEEHDKRFDKIEKRLGRVELELGALAESFYTKALLDDLKENIRERGEKILMKRRNYRIDNKEVDLLLETDRSVYVIEVKIKPKIEDIGRLLSKVELVSKRFAGKKIIPILVGALVGEDVEEQAKLKGIEVYLY
ncbi:MAG: hypothetical protein GXO23_01195, partial [Crenarchaeota archaeon]|nr:hypothetical protein [Thermoproteota archaeon]